MSFQESVLSIVGSPRVAPCFIVLDAQSSLFASRIASVGDEIQGPFSSRLTRRLAGLHSSLRAKIWTATTTEAIRRI